MCRSSTVTGGVFKDVEDDGVWHHESVVGAVDNSAVVDKGLVDVGKGFTGVCRH